MAYYAHMILGNPYFRLALLVAGLALFVAGCSDSYPE